MDMKGISWVGNIYQKFEAMCLEVEEIMYQDTVKYVENQVQTVGSNVKKFYSDVMLDLLPPSSEDAAKDAVSDLPLEFYTDVGMYMKSKGGGKEKHRMIDDKGRFIENQKMTSKHSDGSPLHSLSHVENVFPSSQGFAGGASKQLAKRNTSNKLTAIRKSSRKENLSDKKSGAVIRLDKDLTGASSLCEPSNEILRDSAGGTQKKYGDEWLSKDSLLITKDHHKECADQNAKVAAPGSSEVTEQDSTGKCEYETESATEQIPCILMDGALLNIINSTESGMGKGAGMKPSTHVSKAAEGNAADDCMSSEEEPCANGKEQSSEIAEDFASNSERSDDCSADVRDVDFSIDQEMDIVEQFDKAKLEESCVLVNGDEFHYAPQNHGKNKSYKMKIQDVFSPRKRSSRKHEYEQLAIWPGNDSHFSQEPAEKSMPSLTTKDLSSSLTPPDSCESEWELL